MGGEGSLCGEGISVPSVNDVCGISRAGKWNLYAVAVTAVATGAEIVLLEIFLGVISKRWDIVNLLYIFQINPLL